MNKLAILLIITGCIVAVSCRKKHHDLPSSEKEITSFSVFVSRTESIQGTIRNDSILVQVPSVVSLDSVYVFIKIKGIKITPPEDVSTNFHHPVIYTVTAEDGSTRQYTAVITYLNSDKQITNFVFKSSENSALKEDVTGTIEDSSILIQLSSDADITNLKPSITFKGKTISPANGVATDFSNGATYTITAEDHTTKTYSVIVSYNKYVYIGSADGYVYALHGATGKVKWKYNTGYQVGNPIYKDGTLYVGSSDGTFYALDGETGALKWKFFNQKASFSAPDVEGGIIYVTFFTTNVYTVGIFAINAKSGSLVWKTFSPFTGYGLASAPTYSDGMVFISAYDAGLLVLDAATGDIKWQKLVGLTLSNPAVANGIVYISCETALLDAFDASNGALKWSFSGGPNIRSSPTISKGVVYTPGDDGYIFAIDATTGSLKWKGKGAEINAPIEEDNNGNSLRGFGSPVISDGLLFAGNAACNTYVFDLTTGSPKWNYNNNGGKQKKWLPGPVAAHGMLVTDRDDNLLKAFYAATGKPMWTFTAPGILNTYPCIVDFGGKAFYCGASGNIN
jgi:outer membrane protein assembly factor BamB